MTSLPDPVAARTLGGVWAYYEPDAALAAHEAGHATVATFAGLRVESATIEDGGHVLVAHSDSEPTLANLLGVLGGPLSDDVGISWPPADRDDNSDETKAALLVEYLGIDYGKWVEAVALALEMLAYPATRRAFRAIQAALYEQRTLDGDEVRRIFDEAMSTADHGRSDG